jgi:polyhydroxybutyrate depolymerase
MNLAAKAGKVIASGVLIVLGLLALAVLIIGALFTWVNKTNGEIVSSGEMRRYLLFVPTTYDPARPTPLVISLHGFVEWPAHQMQISHWNDLAQEHGFLVVYPEGTEFPRRWRAGGQVGGSSDPLADVVFISDLIDELEMGFNIDPARIYANGLSNGGGMSHLLGCALSDQIAAIGGVAGAYVYPLEACRPSRPVPMIAFHGNADAIVPYLGGPSRSPEMQLPSIPEWMAARAKLNGCDATPTDLPGSGEVSGIRYSGCDQGAEVEFYTIDGGGHTWPGGDPLPEWIAGRTTHDIDATRVMWEFFSRFALGEVPASAAWPGAALPPGQRQPS